MEYNAIKLLIKLLDEDRTPAAPGFTLHVAHLANADALPMIEAAKKKGALLDGPCSAACGEERLMRTTTCSAMWSNAPPLLYTCAKVLQA